MSLCLRDGRQEVVLTLPSARMRDRDRRASQRPLFIFVTPFQIRKGSKEHYFFLSLKSSGHCKTEAGVQQEVADGRRLPVAVRSSMHTCEIRSG